MANCTHKAMPMYIKKIRELIPEPALYEQLAEECVELAQACLKKSRKLRDENYTPKTMDEINASIEEEFTDVVLSARACGILINWSIEHIKAERWIKRNESKNGSSVI